MQINHRLAYDQLPPAQRDQHAMKLGVKGTYPDMTLPYHNRVEHTAVDGMHTLKDVTCNIMAAVQDKKSFSVPGLALSKASLHEADNRYRNVFVPQWLQLETQEHIVSNPKGLKSHDCKEVTFDNKHTCFHN